VQPAELLHVDRFADQERRRSTVGDVGQGVVVFQPEVQHVLTRNTPLERVMSTVAPVGSMLSWNASLPALPR
jgi:hypothetical protein